MFTGIIEALGNVRQLVGTGAGRRLVVDVACSGDVVVGESIAVNGVCLTVTECEGAHIAFDVGPETLERTNLGALAGGDRVNIERALTINRRLSGHFVQGHVDGVGEITQRRREGEWDWLSVMVPTALAAEMVLKGSVAVDGVSLTIANLDPSRFDVMLIPHTLAHTTLGLKAPGTFVNIETDILGKYVLRAVRELRSSLGTVHE